MNNKKIQQLAKQSNITLDELTENFAKLLVQKCIDVINTIDEGDGKEKGLSAAKYGIRKYFGVL